MLQQTLKKRVTLKRTLTTLIMGVLSMSTILYGGFALYPQKALAATSDTVNFQARLQGVNGNVAPDGFYNVQFKLYSASTGGSALWTESYYDSNGATAGNDNRVKVVNGYVSVALGSQTAFGALKWDQKLYLTMNVGGTTQTASPTYDGEMSPRLSLTAVPYAFTAGQLANTAGSYTSTLSLQGPTGGDQNFVIQDQGAAGTYNLLTNNSGVQLQTATPGTAQTGNLNISGTGIFGTALQSASLLSPSLDVATAGTLTIGGTNATTLNIAANAAAHTINIGTGAAIQAITIGSTTSTSATVIQSGTGGLSLNTVTNGTVGINLGAYTVLNIDSSGRATFQSKGNDSAAFKVQNSTGQEIFAVDTQDSIVRTCSSCSLQVGSSGIYSAGALTFANTGFTNYVTPLGTSITTKINIPNTDPGAYNQLLALGLPSSAAASARAITVADARSAGHQATIAVLSPNEGQIGGLSWDGSNTRFGIMSTSSEVALSNSTGVGAVIRSASSGAQQILEVGAGSTSSGALQFNNATNNNNAILQASSVSASYITNLPTAIGTAGQCVTVASVASTTQTLGYNNCLTSTSGVQLQPSAPGTAQTGYINITGSVRAGTFVLQDGSGVTTAVLQGNGSNLMYGNNTGGATAGVENTFLGTSSGQNNISGDSNVGVGYYTLAGLSTGVQNVAIGERSLEGNSTGNNNVGVGSRALKYNTSGSENVAVGRESLTDNTGGLGNVAIGMRSLAWSQGDRSTAVGYLSLQNATGSYNTAFGSQTGAGITTGTWNTFLGFRAGGFDFDGNFVSTNTTQSTAIGAYSTVQADNTIALGSVTNGTQVVIGTTKGTTSNLFGVSPVFYNTGTASQSGNTITGSGTSWSSGNVRVGMRVIFANGTDGGYITAVGSNTSLTVDTSQTVASQDYRIHNTGFQVTNSGTAYTRTTSATAFAVQNAAGTNLFVADTLNGVGRFTGNVEVTNAVTSNVALKVTAAASQTANILQLVDGTGATVVNVTSTGLGLFKVKPTTAASDGALELGSTAVQSAGDINGVIGFTGNGVAHAQIAYSVGDGFYLCNSSASNISGDYGQCASRVNLYGNIGNFNNSVLTPLVDTSAAAALNIGTTNATSINLNQNTSVASGKSFGIRTVNPSEALTVNGNFAIRDSDTPSKQYRFRTSGSNLDVEGSGSSMYISVWSGADFTGTQHNKVIYENTADITQLIKTVQYRDSGFGTLRHTIDGTTGTDTAFNQDGEATNFSVQGDTDASLLYVKGSTDRVGIGTNTPGYKLDVNGTANASALLSPTLDVATAGTLGIGTTTATTVTLGGAATATINLGTSATNKTLNIGATGTTNNTSAINIGNTTSTGGASTIQIGGTGVTSGSNTGTTVKLQAGQTSLSLANGGATLQTFTNTTTAFQVQTTGNAPVFNVDTTNTRVGVGTASPSEMLHVAGSNSSGRILTKIENTNTGAGSKASGFQLKGGTSGVDWSFATDLGLNGGNNFAIQDNTFGYQPRFFIDSSGQIGLGTDSASASLTFGSGANRSININATGASVAGNTLSVVAGASGTGSVNGGNLMLQAGATGGSGTTGSVLVKANGTNSTTAFQIQNAAGTSLFNVDSTTGAITIGSGGNTATFASTGEMSLAGTARHTKKLILTPEYAGAVLDAAGDTGGAVNCSTANAGTLTSGYVATGRQNYYNWSSTQGSGQCYDLVLQVQLPSDWAAWNGASTLHTYNSVGTDTSSVAVNIIDTTGTNDTAYSATAYNGVSSGTTFAATNLTGYTGTYTADGYMTVKIRMTSSSSKNVRIGNLTLNYYSKF